MTARQMYTFTYSLIVTELGSKRAAEKYLQEWSDEVKRKEMEWKATNDPNWGETEEAAEQLRGVFADFGGSAKGTKDK